jgi:hypothetical protein
MNPRASKTRVTLCASVANWFRWRPGGAEGFAGHAKIVRHGRDRQPHALKRVAGGQGAEEVEEDSA